MTYVWRSNRAQATAFGSSVITGLAGEGGGGNRAEPSSSTEQANGTSVSAP